MLTDQIKMYPGAVAAGIILVAYLVLVISVVFFLFSKRNGMSRGRNLFVRWGWGVILIGSLIGKSAAITDDPHAILVIASSLVAVAGAIALLFISASLPMDSQQNDGEDGR